MQLYAACLASYNSGILYGKWIDASADADEMRDQIATMLRDSPCPNVTVTCPDCEGEGGTEEFGRCDTCKNAGTVPSAEEWAIHDYDDFPNMGEYPSLDDVAAMAELIEAAENDHGINADDLKSISANWHGKIDDISNALDNFAGIYDTLRDYADNLADELMDQEETPANSTARRYFDYEAHARDIEIEYTVIDCPSGVAVFYPH